MLRNNFTIKKENESHVGGIRREPSFSRWCDDDKIVSSLDDTKGTLEDLEFELPVLENKLLIQINMNVSGGHIVDEGTGSQVKYVPFDIENESPRQRHTLDVKTDGGSSRGEEDSGGEDDRDSDTEDSVSLATVLKTLFFILVWYTFSTCLTLYNKTLLGDKLGKFPAPLLMNTFHFAMQAFLANAITYFWSKRFKPPVPMSWRDYYIREIVREQLPTIFQLALESCTGAAAFSLAVPDLTRWTLPLTVVPTALGTALDINLSNASLVFISVTFATMCKSASPIFLLLFAFAFKLESPSFKLLGIMLVISVGVLLTVAKETEFEFWGFVFVMLAAVMSGFRWSMTQILLQKEVYGLKDPITLMSYVAPVMAIATAVLSLFFDPWDEFRKNSYFDSSWHVVRSCLLMFIGGTLAFFMVLTEYILVSATSAVTVTIAGVVKEAVTILVAVFYFHDSFTWLKGIGLIIIMFGVSLFNWYKYQKLQKKEQMSDNDEVEAPTTSAASKYVILEEVDDLEGDA